MIEGADDERKSDKGISRRKMIPIFSSPFFSWDCEGGDEIIPTAGGRRDDGVLLL